MSRPAMLTVDDDPAVSRAVARDLRRRYGQDYQVLRASSGDEALEALRELKLRGGRLAVMLADYRMPQMNGVEFLEQAMDRNIRGRAERRPLSRADVYPPSCCRTAISTRHTTVVMRVTGSSCRTATRPPAATDPSASRPTSAGRVALATEMVVLADRRYSYQRRPPSYRAPTAWIRRR